MEDFFFEIAFFGFVIAFFSFCIANYMNLSIYKSLDENKFPFNSMFLNPFSFSTYELIIKAMFKMNWKLEGENQKLKNRSNKLRKFSGIILLLSILIGVLSNFQ
jgi:hypothetical protein